MIKFQFEKKKLHLFSLGLNMQCGRDFIPHPYHLGKCTYPIFAVILMLAYWSLTLSVFQPPIIKLNRAQRRANHLQK